MSCLIFRRFHEIPAYMLKLSDHPWYSVNSASSKKIPDFWNFSQAKTDPMTHNSTFNSEKDKPILPRSGCHASAKIMALLAMRNRYHHYICKPCKTEYIFIYQVEIKVERVFLRLKIKKNEANLLFPSWAFIWKPVVVTVWENKMLEHGRKKFQGRERDCNGFIGVLSERSKGIWFKVLPPLLGFQSIEIKRKGIFLWCLNTEKRRKIICPRNETL